MAQLSTTYEMTISDAEATLGDIARLEVAILREEAKREAQVQRAKDACEAATAETRAKLAALRAKLDQFILGHRGEFRKPRMRSCVWGTYGLRSSTRTKISDKDAAIRWCGVNGHNDLVVVTEDLVVKGVAKLLRDGERVDGAELVEGEISAYKIDQAILEQQ